MLCQYKSKEESPDYAATRFGDFICRPHGLIITFLAYWHYSICKIDFQYVFFCIEKQYEDEKQINIADTNITSDEWFEEWIHTCKR